MIPKELAGMLFSRMEYLKRETLEEHPDYGKVEELKTQAEALTSHMSREDIDTIDGAAGMDAAVHFQVGYLLGLKEGLQGGAVLKGGV